MILMSLLAVSNADLVFTKSDKGKMPVIEGWVFDYQKDRPRQGKYEFSEGDSFSIGDGEISYIAVKKLLGGKWKLPNGKEVSIQKLVESTNDLTIQGEDGGIIVKVSTWISVSIKHRKSSRPIRVYGAFLRDYLII